MLSFQSCTELLRPASGAQAYFPSVVSLDDEQLVVCFDQGADMEAVDVRSFTIHSADGGEQWSEPVVIHEPGPGFSTLCRISKAENTELLAALTILTRMPGEGLANPKTDGYVDTALSVARSRNGGSTWGAPAQIPPAIPRAILETCAPILDLGDGVWLYPTSLFRNWQGEAPHGLKAVALRSTDAGEHWPEVVTAFDFIEEKVAAWEQKQVRLSDGRVMAVCWAYDLANRLSLKNRYTFSGDTGASFGKAFESPLHGETCGILALPENHVLCAYRRTDVKGLWAHLARIEGERWIPFADEPLWGVHREAYGIRAESMLEEMTTLQFGYPSLALLEDGLVFGVFWCVEEGKALIRSFRLEVSL